MPAQNILCRLPLRRSLQKRITRLARRLLEIVVVGTRDLRDFGTSNNRLIAKLLSQIGNPTSVLRAGFSQLMIEMGDADIDEELAGRFELVQSQQERGRIGSPRY